jgi:hypothetical protein
MNGANATSRYVPLHARSDMRYMDTYPFRVGTENVAETAALHRPLRTAANVAPSVAPSDGDGSDVLHWGDQLPWDDPPGDGPEPFEDDLSACSSLLADPRRRRRPHGPPCRSPTP